MSAEASLTGVFHISIMILQAGKEKSTPNRRHERGTSRTTIPAYIVGMDDVVAARVPAYGRTNTTPELFG